MAYDKQQPFNEALIEGGIEGGILPDGCGVTERFFDGDVYIDLCGMDIDEVVKNLNKQAGLTE